MKEKGDKKPISTLAEIRLKALQMGIENGVYDVKQTVLFPELDRYAKEIGLLLPPEK